MITEKILWALPAALVALCDFGVTLASQAEIYWRDRSAFVESNPLFAYLLSIHPGWFLTGALVWILEIISISLLLPRLLSLICSSSFVAGHSFGILTWLLYKHGVNFQIVYIYFPIVACLIIWQAKIYFSPQHHV